MPNPAGTRFPANRRVALPAFCPNRISTVLWLAGILALAIPAAGPQAATPQTTPSQPASSQPAPSQRVSGPSNPAPGTLNLQVHVPLVVEDIVVLDREDRPIHGLKASDFTITEDGKPVIPQSFEEHTAVTEQQAAAAPRPPHLGMNIFTNVTTTPANSSLNILLLDALNTPMNDQAYVRQQMLKYLKSLPPGIRVAIFGLSTRLYILQGFTSDPAVLKAAVDSKRANARASSLMDDPMSGAPVEQMSDFASDTMGNDPDSAMIIANMQQFEAETATFQTTLRMQYTLAAMGQLARYLSGLPGRKNLIWFSGSFPLNILPDDMLPDPFGATASYADDVRKTTDLLARSQVAVYPVDARGLFTNPALGASQKSPNFTRNPTVFATMNTKFLQQTSQEHGTMDKMAEDTGGKAFYNTNGLKEAVEQAVNFGSNYYTFSYTPANRKWDGRYRKIAVKADRSGWRLYYRKGYLADDPEAETRGQKVLPMTALQAAMMRGGPDPTQLLFDVRVVPDDVTTDKLSGGGKPISSKPVSSLMKPPYRSYLLDFLLDTHNVKLVANSEGSFQGSIEFAVLVYGADGQPVNEAVNTVSLNLKPDRYAQLLAHGLLFRQSIDAPAKGEYFLRIGVHDPASDRVGAVEIPVSGLKSKQAMIQAQQKPQP